MTNQEAIDIVKSAIAQVEWDYPMEYAAAFDKAIEALEEQKPGWISVKGRLPEMGEVVLAFGTRSATTGMFQGTMPNRPDVWMWKNHTPKRVSHWMELPEPPRSKENGLC